jgi:hypothetical protein
MNFYEFLRIKWANIKNTIRLSGSSTRNNVCVSALRCVWVWEWAQQSSIDSSSLDCQCPLHCTVSVSLIWRGEREGFSYSSSHHPIGEREEGRWDSSSLLRLCRHRRSPHVRRDILLFGRIHLCCFVFRQRTSRRRRSFRFSIAVSQPISQSSQVSPILSCSAGEDINHHHIFLEDCQLFESGDW